MINKNISKRKSILLFMVTFFVVGNISFYLKERSKWIYPEQPYPKAKEWLIPANMMLVYGTTLTKLPFIDERSFVMKPIIGLQDYFVSKWQENLPDDDVEKYLGWYTFRLRTYIEPNAGGIILYGSREYTFDEVIDFNEQIWKTIEDTVKYEAKDKLFNKMRYAAFNNLTAIFVSNFTAYWIHNPVSYNPDFLDQSILEERYLTSNSYVNSKAMLSDDKQYKRLQDIYYWIVKMDNLYALGYPKVYIESNKAASAPYWINTRMQELTKTLIYYLIETKDYQKQKDFCSVEDNTLLADYIKSKKWLLEHEKFLKTKSIGIEKTVSDKRDKQIEIVCKNLNIPIGSVNIPIGSELNY